MTWPLGDPWVIFAALLLDAALGEPPNAVHPVSWMGSLIGWLRRRSPTVGRVRPFLAGAAIVLVGAAISVAVGIGVIWLRESSAWLGFAIEVILVKAMFSFRGLLTAAAAVRRTLTDGDLPEARRLLSWHLVSRETADLDEPRVAAAVVESVAENASDSLIAPWVLFLTGGLPAMAAYRYVNTCDAMLGYRDAEREWLGKFPARLDDALNLVPSRLTAFLMIVASPSVGGSMLEAGRVCRRDARRTASPNAGYPMSAAAGTLGVELEKIGHYRLNAGARLPTSADIGRVIRLVIAIAVLAVVLTAARFFV